MKHYILLTLTFILALFIANCSNNTDISKASPLAVQIINDAENDAEGDSTSRTISIKLPSNLVIRENGQTDNSYILHYVNTKEAFPTQEQEIDSILPISLDTLTSISSKKRTHINKHVPVPGEIINFNIIDLKPDTIYLFFIESAHLSSESSYTSITKTSGWFKTDPETPIDNPNVPQLNIVLSGAGDSRTVEVTLPQTEAFNDIDSKEYEYSLYYVNASDAFPDQNQDITSLLPKTKDDIRNSLYKKQTEHQTAEAGETITFSLNNLLDDTIYLYVVEALHRSKENFYTDISESSGWFRTLLLDVQINDVNIVDRTITATTPSADKFGVENPSDFSYTLYYVNTRTAYPTSPQNIASFLPITGGELSETTTGLEMISQTAVAGGTITFNLNNDLRDDTIYLYSIKTAHNTNANYTWYTAITETSGWFRTLLLDVSDVQINIVGRTITATTPSADKFGVENPSDFSYTLYYVNTRTAYPTSPQNIASFLPITGGELSETTTGLEMTSQNAEPGTTITFNLNNNLQDDTIYLYSIKTAHNTNANYTWYTAITETSGWFKTSVPDFSLQSTSFTDGANLDAQFYGTETGGFAQQNGAANTSPQLSWMHPPAGTNGYLIVMYDESANNWIHWLRKENASVSSVAEGVGTTPDASKQFGTNSSSAAKYAGPQPPSGTHVYVIKIFALDQAITENISAGTFDANSGIKPALDNGVGENLVGTIQILGIASLSVNAAYLP